MWRLLQMVRALNQEAYGIVILKFPISMTLVKSTHCFFTEIQAYALTVCLISTQKQQQQNGKTVKHA